MSEIVDRIAHKLRAVMEHDSGVLIKRTTADALARAVIGCLCEPTEPMIRAMRGRAIMADCKTYQGARDIWSNAHYAMLEESVGTWSIKTEKPVVNCYPNFKNPPLDTGRYWVNARRFDD